MLLRYPLVLLILNIIISYDAPAASAGSVSTVHSAEDLKPVFYPFSFYRPLSPFDPKRQIIEDFAVCITPPQEETARFYPQANVTVDDPRFLSVTKDGRLEIVDREPENVLKKNGREIDERALVDHSNKYPDAVHGYLKITFGNGASYIGTGMLVGPYHVLTAGHNVYSHARGEEWPVHVEFMPGRNGRRAPFGIAQAMALLSVEGWVNRHDTSCDIGMIILSEAIGERTGWYGLLSGEVDSIKLLLKDRNVNVTGYPEDYGESNYKGTELRTMAKPISRLDAKHLYYPIDTSVGQSGSGIWTIFGGKRYTAGIHTYYDRREDINLGTRISKPIFNLLVQWLKGHYTLEELSVVETLSTEDASSTSVISSDIIACAGAGAPSTASHTDKRPESAAVTKTPSLELSPARDEIKEEDSKDISIAIRAFEDIGKVDGYKEVKILKLRRTAITSDKQIKFVLMNLTSLKKLVELDLGNCDLNATHADILSSLPQLRILHLYVNHIEDAGATHISKLTNLTGLSLGGNQIGDAGVAHISKLTNLTNLSLGGNQIGDAGVAYIGKLTGLTSLYLGFNKIGAAGAAHIGKLTNLISLDFSNNHIGDAGAACIGKLTNLTSLDLSSNHIEDAGAEHIGKLTNLTSLDLSRNYIGNAGAEYISKLTNLTRLKLWDTKKIGDVGAEYIGKLTNLTSLDLALNLIGEEGARHISKLTGLTSLNLALNHIGDAGAAHIGKLTGLTSLDLMGNQIGDAGAAHIGKLTGLTSLDLSSNHIGDEGVEHIGKLTILTVLKLSKNKIGAAGVGHLVKLNRLSALNLEYNKLKGGIFGPSAGARAISILPTIIKELYLEGNGLGSASQNLIREHLSTTDIKF